ncbi:MAG: geranylgeranylglycerol-phosphate geranylgeranyltransferase [Bacteroidetes bacterium]|nr:geranylgeranylglycerol-phosphate geranylgeranyltransferase [Bacteroidota bacterium]
MFSFLKLIRVQNLLIIAFTQCMVRWCLVAPLLKIRGYELQLSNFLFSLLVLSTVMVAAAGYVINDYFDINIDKINKPERLVIGKGVKRRVAIGAHTVMNFIAILIGFYISYSIGAWKLIVVYFFWAFGLWFYSTHFKRQFLIGNLIIAVFVALVPLVVGIYELLLCYKVYSVPGEIVSFKEIWDRILAITFFAFVTTLLREMIKDIEDYEGDKKYGCKTLPIVIGIKPAKIGIVAITIITMLSLASMQLLQWRNKDMVSFFYFSIALQLPFVFLIYKTVVAQTKKEYRFAGITAKFIMLMGICYLFLFAYLTLSHLHVV